MSFRGISAPGYALHRYPQNDSAWVVPFYVPIPVPVPAPIDSQDHILNALEDVFSAGIVGHYQRASAAVRLRRFGAYPIIEDNSQRAKPLTVVNASVGYDFGRIEVAADLLNAFDAKDNEIEYFYTSRLAGEPLAGVDDHHIKPIEPRQLRLSATVRF